MSNPSQNRQGQKSPQNETEKITNIQNLLQNGIEQIRRKQNLAKDYYQVKKTLNLLQDKLEQDLLQNGLEQIAKMQNLSQNELDQITKMQNLSRNELEQIAKMRRI